MLRIATSSRAPKLLVIASAVELQFGYGCTPAWWQLWKAMHEAGVELIVTPYRGDPVQSLWWRTEPNPCRRQGEWFERLRKATARLRGDTHLRRSEDSPRDALGSRLVREVIWRHVTPRWQRHLEAIVERERSIDAVVVFGVPMSHLRGVPTAVRERYGVPFVYYDPDVPMSLPEYGGMDTGFNIYHGADPGEYDLVLSNSEGGLDRLLALGARRAEHLFWGVDPDVFAPRDVQKEYDVLFYGYGTKFRQRWLTELIGTPSERMTDVDFAVGGADFRDTVGRARTLPYLDPSRLPEAISAARINVNVARRPHASVRASSTSRLFELAGAGAAIVTNPYEGIERWFEPGSELLVVGSSDEAVETYGLLLDDPEQSAELGRRARERVLEEHTVARRVERLLELIGVGRPSAAVV
jgi:glycosyltransferase involved in cell wall biosynthesis